MVLSLPLLSFESSVSVKENPDRKKSTFKRAGLQWLSSNKHIIQHIVQLFLNQLQAAVIIWMVVTSVVKYTQCLLDILITSSTPVK